MSALDFLNAPIIVLKLKLRVKMVVVKNGYIHMAGFAYRIIQTRS